MSYSLPDLPYDYGALEPYCDGKVLELHHGKHHAAYVKGVNQTLERLAEARGREEFESIVGLEKTLAFNLSGHILHSIFWQNMTPKGGGAPTGDFASAIKNDFGGFDHFRRQLTEVASTIMGSGYRQGRVRRKRLGAKSLQQLRDRHPPRGMNDVRRDLSERREHEAALVHARVGDD